MTTTNLDNDDWRVPSIHYLLDGRRTTELAVSYIIWNFETATAHGRWHRCRPFQSSNTDGWTTTCWVIEQGWSGEFIHMHGYHMPKLVTLWFSIDIVSYNNAPSRKESIMLQQISSWAKLLSYMFGTLERESTWALLKLRSKAPKRPAVNGGMLSGQCRDSPRHYSCLFICTGPTCPN